ncbi:MAG TPA: VWA domain-containing protein [Pirellulales bacterium]|nr:VWA domain-containing protein [Pirellulales bacterium]
MTFTSPFWLILAVPALVVIWLRPMPSRVLTVLRVVTVLLLLLAICGLCVMLPSRSGCVVMVADRSLSMPPGSEVQEAEAAELLYRSMGPSDELAVVSFGERTAVEQPPQSARFGGFVADVGAEASNLAEAVDRAVSLVPPERPGRIVVLSDGHATGGDVAAAAARAASAGIAIDYRAIERSGAGDLAVERIDAPSSVAAAEAFMISAWVHSPRPQDVSYELISGEHVLASGTRSLPAGRSRLVFRDKAGDAGARSYTLRVNAIGSNDDPVVENNRARFLVGVRGVKPVLCVGPTASSLPKLLEAGGLKVVRRSPEKLDWSLAELAAFAAVLVEDIPAGQIGTAGMETLAAWIGDAGGGLLLTGGRNAYGTGGYFKSALEGVLPVSMELRREHRKLSLAIVVALDRSGSMAMTVPGGRQKIELADLATCEVLNQLSGADEFGCLAVDSIAHEIVPLSDLKHKAEMERMILRIDSMGGGIFIDEALEKAAAMIAPATAGAKHIILFADAADSEQPGDYRTLLEKCTKAGITVSVIGLGTERDTDAALLKDVAACGGGQCMFTDNAQELPRLFAQDTFLVSRSTFVEEPTGVRATAGMAMLSSQPWGELPQVGGYNLCYLRPGANLAAVTRDEYQAPLVAAWQAGIGRVLCYTGEADGKYTGPIGTWPHAGEFFCSLSRWASAQDQGLGSDMLLTQQLRGGTARIELHLDSERTGTPFSALPQVTVLRALDGQKPTAERLPLAWTSADVLSIDVPLAGKETLLTSVDVPGVGHATLPPTCLPYSPEFALHADGEGRPTLERMARTTGGIERVNLTGIWNDLPRMPRQISLVPWLLLSSAVLLLAEVLQRRTGIFSLRWRRPASVRVAKPTPAAEPKRSAAAPLPKTRKQPAKLQPSPPAPVAEPAATPRDTVADALTQARNRATRRTQR